jgi:hypothetical protein
MRMNDVIAGMPNAGMSNVMAYGWHLSDRDANNCIGITLNRSNHNPCVPLTRSSSCKLPQFPQSLGDLFNTANPSLSALTSARGQAVVHTWVMIFMRASVRCQTDCADVDTTVTTSFAKSWKPVQESCNTSRCTIRCFWD